MKKLLSKMLLVIAVCIGLTACSDEQNYLQSVPSDSSIVMKVNLVSMFQKSGVAEMEAVSQNLPMLKEQLPENLKETLGAVIDNPAESGIDLTQPLVLAMGNPEKVEFVALLAVADHDRLVKFMQALSDTPEIPVTLKDEKKYHNLMLPALADGAEVVFDETRLLLRYSKNSHAKSATELLSLPKSESILKNEKAELFVKSNDDFALFMDYENLLKDASLMMKQLGYGNMGEIYEGMAMCETMNFENGKLVAKTSVSLNGKMKEIQDKVYATANGKFLDQAPSNSYMVMQGGSKNLDYALEAMGQDEFRKAEEELKNSGIDIDIKQLLASLSGDMLVYVGPGEKFPTFGVFCETKNSLIWDLIKEAIMENPIDDQKMEVGDNYFRLKLEEFSGTDYMLKYEDNALSLSPVKKGAGSFASHPYAKVLKNCGMVIDLDAISQDALLNQVAATDNELKLAQEIMSLFTVLTAESTNKTEGEMILYSKTQDQNILKTCIEKIGEAMNAYNSRKYSAYHNYSFDD